MSDLENIDQAFAARLDYYNSPEMLELERIIAAVIARKNDAPEGSAEYRMALRQLEGLRWSCEEAGPIMEDLDPFGWGYC
jgi:hypothetical protein